MKLRDSGQVRQIVMAYQNGDSATAIAKQTSVSPGVVLRTLRREGIGVRQKVYKRERLRIPSDTHQLAYLAGIIDIKATLSVKRTDAGKLLCQLIISSPDEQMMDWLSTTLGEVPFWDPVSAANHRTRAEGIWQIRRRNDMRALLAAVLPYLVAKRARAEVAIAELAGG